MRTGRDIHHRVGAVDTLELVVFPTGPLCTFVLAVADLHGRPLQRLRRGRCVEEKLDHFPVAFVEVVPVVEGVEQPVLERQLLGTGGIDGDVRVDGGLRRGGDRAGPPLVAAAGAERVAGKIEVVSVEPLPDLRRRRPDRDQVRAIPGAAQGDSVCAEENVDVERPVRLAWAAFLRLGDKPHDRRVPLGERPLISKTG